MKLYTIITAASTKQFKIILRFLIFFFLVRFICNVSVHLLGTLFSISEIYSTHADKTLNPLGVITNNAFAVCSFLTWV